MMTAREIDELQKVRDGACLTILMPLYTRSPDDQQQTPIRLKNLSNRAHDCLKAHDLSDEQRKAITAHLGEAMAQVDAAHHARGLAIFANGTMHRIGYLPFEVAEHVILEPTFATRELVLASKRSPRYRVLSVTEKSVHLYEGTRETLSEIKDDRFPKGSTQEGVETQLDNSFGVELSHLQDAEARNFFQRVDDALAIVQDTDPLPLALVGVERTMAYFEKVTRYKDAIVARLHGNFEKVPQHEMEAKIWPLVEAAMTQSNDRVLQRLEDAVGAGRAAFGIYEVWNAAQNGRVDLILAEENFQQRARKTAPGEDGISHLQNLDETGEGEELDDAVDDIIEIALQNGGDVTFFSDGRLSQNQRLPQQTPIAAILRY